MNAPYDRRLTPARGDLAAAHLKGKVEAARFVPGERRQVVAATAPMRRAPRADAMLDTELLFGEGLTVYDEAEGWAWGQAESDGYVGYVPAATLGAPEEAPTHRVSGLATHIYPRADFKTPPLAWLSHGSLLRVKETGERFAHVTMFGAEGHVPVHLLAGLGSRVSDYVSVAERFVGVPYLWGGRSSAGLDCSSLVQLSLAGAGLQVPRDTDMQEAAIGKDLGGPEALSKLRRGDLIFWKGHVAIALDRTSMVHANATAMAVSVDPIRAFAERIEQTDGPVTRVRRPFAD